MHAANIVFRLLELQGSYALFYLNYLCTLSIAVGELSWPPGGAACELHVEAQA